MNIQLKQIRQNKGLSQEEMASKLSELMECEIKVSRYGTWERGDRMMNLEQAYYCATALGCTLNDLVGMKSDELTDAESKLLDDYRTTTTQWKRVISEQAANAAKEHPKTETEGVERWTA